MEILGVAILYGSQGLLPGCSSCLKLVGSQSNEKYVCILIELPCFGAFNTSLAKHNQRCRNNLEF